MKLLTGVDYRRVASAQQYLKNHYQIPVIQGQELIVYHCYWYGRVNWRHITSISSCLATQEGRFEIWLWFDIDSDGWRRIPRKLMQLSPKVKCLKYDWKRLAVETPLANVTANSHKYMFDLSNLPLRADCARYLILYKYGGVYFDLDFIFLKCLRPLCHMEFTYKWSHMREGNNALFRLFALSKTGLEILESTRKLKASMINARNIFQMHSLPELYCLPCTWFDPLWLLVDKAEQREKVHQITRLSNFDEFITKSQKSKRRVKRYQGDTKKVIENEFFPGLFGYHWHGRWSTAAHGDSWLCFIARVYSVIHGSKKRR